MRTRETISTAIFRDPRILKNIWDRTHRVFSSQHDAGCVGLCVRVWTMPGAVSRDAVGIGIWFAASGQVCVALGPGFQRFVSALVMAPSQPGQFGGDQPLQLPRQRPVREIFFMWGHE
jgi:hypothetical protein